MSVAPLWPEVPAPSPGPSSPAPFDLARLGRSADAVWRAAELGPLDAPVLATGFEALDRELPGGGWPCRSLTEILLPQPALCEWRLLAPALARLASAAAQVFLVAPPRRAHAPGLAQAGIDADRLVWLDAATPAERLWTTEQLVKASPEGAILAWLPQARPEQIRRLQLHAQGCEAPVFLLRPQTAGREASPAPLRLAVSLGRRWTLEVRILKRRGAPHAGVLALNALPALLAQALPPRLRFPSPPGGAPAVHEKAADDRALGRAAAAA